MTDLKSCDMQALLHSISILNSDISEATLQSRIFEALSNCISTEIRALDGWTESGQYTGTIRYNPDDWASTERMEVFNAYAGEHPLLIPLLIKHYPGALKISDFLNTKQFHRTGLFNEFYKDVGVHEQMITVLNLATDSRVTVALCRSRRDFSERDRTVFDLLRPHLESAFKNTNLFNGVINENRYLELGATRGIVVLNKQGRIKYLNSRAVHLLRKYFNDFREDALPEQLEGFFQRQVEGFANREYFVPANRLRLARDFSELNITLGADLKTDEMILAMEETSELGPEDFRSLGLTKREMEILCWIQRGKTDDTIASLCSISTRTVQKHVEHIRQKLNVETRTAAIAVAFDRINHYCESPRSCGPTGFGK